MTRFLAELRFWCAFVWETATRRRLRAVIRSRLRGVRGRALRRADRRRQTRAERATSRFPEGRASAELGDVRDGAGRFLSLVPVPTLPVAVHEEGGAWVVTFGTPIAWSRRKELCDVQLGMAIADLLPAHVAPDWQRLLADWRGAHAQSHRSIGCRS